jgi:cysteine desulfurase
VSASRSVPDPIYLDHASATPLVPAARQAVLSALDAFGDPLRLHAEGLGARAILDQAHATVAEAIGAHPDEIVFTSGGTESVALAIWGGVRPIREIGRRIVTTRVEHPAVGGVLTTLESDGFETVLVRTDPEGRVDLDEFAAEIRRPGTLIASVQHANHEVGTIQPIAEAARLCREAGVLFHTDACQTVGRMPVDVRHLAVDLLSLSAHKFGGPAGAGALFVRRGVPIAAYPCGDDRERKRRSGMENVPGIAGMSAALGVGIAEMADRAAEQWRLTGRLRERIVERVPGARVHGHAAQRVPHLMCFSIDGADSEILGMALDDRGFRIGVGSTCTRSTGEPSPVLEQLGYPATTSFRVGIGPTTTEEDLDRFVGTLGELVESLRRVASV